mgnify:CR=1 FL=1
MIISKTPYRISFFGGGSDYPEWFKKESNFGEVISTTIDKYVYLSIRELTPFFGYKYRFSYSKIEVTNDYKDIEHKALKGLIKHYKPNTGLEIHYAGDLPAKSGMGSSSSFSVGLLKTYNAIIDKKITTKQLALDSINLEQNILKEAVGCQDQVAAAYGGFNQISFSKNGFKIKKFDIHKRYFSKLNQNFFLIYSGQQRYAHEVVNTFIKKLNSTKEKHILKILDHVDLAKKIIANESLDDFGYLLNETWQEKKKISPIISNNKINEIYNLGIKSGSLGGKLLGAGNGGFILFYVPKKNHKKFIKNFKSFIDVKFKFSDKGSEIIYNNDKNL